MFQVANTLMRTTRSWLRLHAIATLPLLLIGCGDPILQTPALHTLLVVDRRVAWVGGAAGIYRTTDGGRAWTKCALDIDTTRLPLHLRLRAGGVLWADSHLALVRTAEGVTRFANGKTETLPLPLDHWGQFEEIAFVNDAVGWANRVGELYQTVNGGRSWTQIPRPPGREILGLIPVSEDEAWLSTHGEVDLWHTLNRGALWTPLNFTVGKKLGGFIRLTNEEWFAQATTWDGFLYHSTNSGHSWDPRAVSAKLPVAYSFTGREGWLLDRQKDDSLLLLHTKDRGKNWGVVGPRLRDYRLLRSLEGGQLWLLSPKGRVMVVENHGAAWREATVVRTRGFWSLWQDGK
jgi:photosystem II stability/assembly factor-like uncharacterized protein